MGQLKDNMVGARNRTSAFLYKHAAKPLFFRIEPEPMHDKMISVGGMLGSNAVTKALTSLAFSYSNKALEQEILGIRFPNPIGLAAGFDKDARMPGILPSVGFGHAELGSITAKPYAGNEGTRLWRLVKSQSLVINYGLKNIGAEKIAAKLRGKRFGIPIGTSIAKTNCEETAETEAGVRDYAEGFRAFTDIGDYFTINISCPNAFGGLPFTNRGRLERLLAEIDAIPTDKPVFIKMPPDLPDEEFDSLVDVALAHRVHGLIISNLTKPRDNPRLIDDDIPEIGGISGKAVEPLADRLIERAYRKAGERLVIIGCGGVFTAEDAYSKIRKGASLIQMITGMIFLGPQAISEINRGLVRLLKRDGYTNLSEAIGVDVK